MTRFTWAIVGGVLTLVALSLGLAVVAPARQAAPDLGTPGGVVLSYALAVQSGDLDQAWSLLASSAQAQTTQERFINRSQGFRSQYERARLSVEDARQDGESARVDLVRAYPASGGILGLGGGPYSTRSSVRLTREAGQWRITSPPDAFVLDKLP